MSDTDAAATLRKELGGGLDVLDELTAAEAADLLAMVQTARRVQNKALADSIDDVLGHLPRLVRIPARKIMFG